MRPNDTSDHRSTAPVFGYDHAGNCHRYDAVRAEVIVTRDGTVTHVEPLARDLLDEWIDHVAATRGWIDHWEDAQDIAEARARHRAAKAQAADICYDEAREVCV